MKKKLSKTNDEQQTTSASTFNYVSSMYLDIKLVIAITLFALICILTPTLNTTLLRPIVGVIIISFLPGYTILAAVFPSKKDFNHIERIVFSLVLSPVTIALVGVAVNFTPPGIGVESITVSLAIIVVLTALIANRRRHDLSTAESPFFSLTSVKRIPELIIPVSDDRSQKIVSVVLVIAICAAGLSLTYIVTTPRPSEHYTEFYVLDQNGTTENYPSTIKLGQNCSVVLGVRNHEYKSATYNLTVLLGNDTESHVIYANQLNLGQDQKWEQLIELKPDITGTSLRLEFKLHSDSDISTRDKDLHLWITVTN